MTGPEHDRRLDPWRARLLRRRSVLAACLVLCALVSSAVYAPFLANDRPYVMDAIDHRALRSAAGSLEPIARDWQRCLREYSLARRAALSRGAPEEVHAAFERREALVRETRALTVRIATLRHFVDASGERATELADFELAVRGWSGNVLERDIDDLEPSSAVVAGAVRLRDAWAGTSGAMADLRSRRSFPLFSALSWGDWWITLGWTGALLLLARGASPRRMLAWASASAVLAWLATAALAQPRMLSTPSIKDGLLNGDIQAKSVVFAPLAFGFDETNLTEIHRPPTWWPTSEIDEQGRYVRGPRALAADPATGFQPSSTPVEVRFAEPERNALSRHWMGTDALGRDVLARVLWGGRPSLLVGAASMLAVSLIGLVLGALAGYFRGWVDDTVSAAIQLLQSFPSFLLMLAAIAIGSDGALGASCSPLWFVVAVIAVVGWTGIARLVRAEVLRVRELDYVAAARALGFSPWRVLAVHVLPNSVQPAIVAAAFSAASAILTESAVSFLGFGVRAPTPSWGAVMQAERSTTHLWTFVFPGLAVFATCASCAWIGDALRDALDPKEDA